MIKLQTLKEINPNEDFDEENLRNRGMIKEIEGIEYFGSKSEFNQISINFLRKRVEKLEDTVGKLTEAVLLIKELLNSEETS